MTAGALLGRPAAGRRYAGTLRRPIRCPEAAAGPGQWPDRPAADGGACDPVSASTVTIPVAVIAIRTPTAAATPDSASIRRLGALTACGKPLDRNDPARCVTSCRYDCASGLESEHSHSTSSRRSYGARPAGP